MGGLGPRPVAPRARGALVAILLLLLLVPDASALQALEARSVAVGGAYVLDAGFSGLFMDVLEPLVTTGDLQGSGETIQVEAARTRYNMSNNVVPLSPAWHWTEAAEHQGDFRIRPLDGLEIMIEPTAPGSLSAHASLPAASFQVSPGFEGGFRDASFHPGVQGDFMVGRSIAPAWDQPVTLELEGGFRVLLWDAAAEFDGGSYRAGDGASPMDPPWDLAYPALYRYDSAILVITVQNGRLDIPFQEVETGLFLSSAVLDGSGVVRLEDAVLADSGTRGEIRFLGDSTMDLTPGAGERLVVAPVAVETMRLDGQVIPWDPSKGPAPVWPWVAVPLAVVAALVAVPAGARARLAHLAHKLERLDYPAVARASGWVFLSRWTAPRASLFKATALLVLGEYGEARCFLDSLPDHRRPDAATYHLLQAHAAAGQGDREAAQRGLQICLGIDPSYVVEASVIGILRPFLVGCGGDSSYV